MTSEHSTQENKPEESSFPTKSGWYEDPDGSDGLRWYDAQTGKWSDSVTEAVQVDLGIEGEGNDATGGEGVQPINDTEEAAPGTSKAEEAAFNAPVAAQWKTYYGYSTLGAVCGFAFYMILTIIISMFISAYVGEGPVSFPASSLGVLAGAPAGVITYLLTLIYASVFYSSFFELKPFLKSSKVISFTNLFFGGVLFGCLWNWNLTKSHRSCKKMKGVSWGYAIALSVLGIFFVGWSMLTVDIPKIESAKQYNINAIGQGYASSDSASFTSGSQQGQSSSFSDKEAGISFVIPDGWRKGSISPQDPVDTKCVILPISSSTTAEIGFMYWDAYETELDEKTRQKVKRSDVNLSIYNKEDILENTERYFSQINNESAEIVTINNRQYWRSEAEGVPAKGALRDGSSGSMVFIDYFSVDNGYCYYFMASSIVSSSDERIALEEAMSTLMESIQYSS